MMTLNFFYDYRKLHHPNIITLMGASFDISNSRVLFVTNYIDGNNLGALIFNSDVYEKVC